MKTDICFPFSMFNGEYLEVVKMFPQLPKPPVLCCWTEQESMEEVRTKHGYTICGYGYGYGGGGNERGEGRRGRERSLRRLEAKEGTGGESRHLKQKVRPRQLLLIVGGGG